ncbi:MAG: hypothetical protein H6739_22785 [Alphaproteobacteria bacterium]|nr:hypothetical protein [Alphaproteobacteria bacterium]
MPTRPSEPILAWLRETMKSKGMNIAALAESTGEKRSDIRRVLGGREPLTVDQLVGWTRALGVDMNDLVGADLGQVPEPEPESEPPVRGPGLRAVRSAAAARRVDDEDDADDPFNIDPYGLQAEQAIRLGFALGVNFTFVCDATQLDDDSGVPGSVRERFGDNMPIQLDAAYHRFNEPHYDEYGLTCTLSFGGTKHVCVFPWSSLNRVIYFIEPPPPLGPRDDEPEPSAKGRPTLRLVK